ncbi:restriction endonuclease subunit S [Acidocella facilis]|uniref:restriction endonuclease subunit S n=1 Tax=Acidocella facilis TaxID=525 RepID=UPI001F2AF479|nr:restriction endonuclease subunit S [Acidocella facilis]
MGEWRESTWGDEISLEYGKGIRNYADANAPYRVYGSNGPVGWTSEPLAQGPGIILGRKGAYRGVRISKEPFFVIDTAYYVVPKSDLDIRWLYYAIIHHKLGEIDDGSPIPSTTRSAVYVRELSVPKKSEQQAIASILSALDDKIELNRQMNETLEAMARVVFKDWFVDFGPTRAKMEGRAPYLAPEIWSLFPDRLDDEGKPQGWRAGKLGDVAQQVGQTVSPETLDPNTPYIGLEHMPRRSIALSDWEGAGKVTSGKLAFEKRDLLFGKLRPYFHKVGIAPLDGICSTDIVVLNARQRSAAAFVLVCISQDEFVAFTDRTSDGTKMPRTSWSRMERYGVYLPGDAALEAFNAIANPMLGRIVANIHESRTLAATRDLLLPKLMSGEIRVQDAEKVLEAVA